MTIGIAAWAVWAVVTTAGLCLFLLRSSESGLSYVSLPKLLYFFWILLCVMLMCAGRSPELAAAALIVAFCGGAYALVGDETMKSGRGREVLDRVEGCRRAIAEDARNPMALEMLGDAYSTMENRDLALRYWERSYAIVSNAKLLEKMERVRREKPVFHYWGAPCSYELISCGACERPAPRGSFRCAGCGAKFYPGRASWLLFRFNREWEASGAGSAAATGLALLPFLFLCSPPAYLFAWLCWLGARRRDPEASAPGAFSTRAELGTAALRAAVAVLLLGAWSARAGWAKVPSFAAADEKKPAPGRPARVSAKVSWTATP